MRAAVSRCFLGYTVFSWLGRKKYGAVQEQPKHFYRNVYYKVCLKPWAWIFSM